jgi:hypothetical protein
MPTNPYQPRRKGTRVGLGLFGAVLIHPVVVLAAFLHGNLFGTRHVWQPGRLYFGLEGGWVGAENVATVYILSLGITPLIASAGGAILAIGLCKLAPLLPNWGYAMARAITVLVSTLAFGLVGLLVGRLNIQANASAGRVDALLFSYVVAPLTGAAIGFGLSVMAMKMLPRGRKPTDEASNDSVRARKLGNPI